MIEPKIQSLLEAVLFASGEPIEISKLSSALEIDELVIEENLNALAEGYIESEAGIRLLKLDDKFQLCSCLDYAPQIRAVLQQKRNAPLSNAAFEVLAIIAYNQPVTKAFIEQVRGVDCSAVIGNLCAKELIEEVGRLDLPGRPLVYGTTPNFLRCFCMESLSELPSLPEDDEPEESDGESDEAAPEKAEEAENA